MFRISCLILIAIIFSVHSMQRQFLYSILDKEVTNSSLAMPYGEVASRVYCAGLCSGDDYCMEFFYNTTSRQCIGLHCVKKGNYSYQFIAPAPLSMLYFGKEINWVEYSGNYYFYGEESVTWADGKLECQKRCAHLVEIETKEESDWLAATFLLKEDCSSDSLFTCTAWTGGNDLDNEGHYVWDHSNTSIVFTNWNTYEPSRLNLSFALTRDCIDMFRNGKWNDRPCSYGNQFICEK
ncbi:collectin-12-like [Crassostrea angulata]|uniref:collectin-12-like n=1 Tax=Magallana angulata TaxID=2784310 RepID=UPI0022B16E57|nr:collectin-12-like [Crassostrea angulata]